MKYIIPLAVVIMFICCAKEGEVVKPDIATGLTVYITLDGTATDSVGTITGSIHNSTLTDDRYGDAGKAMAFNASDSAYIDMGDLAGASFTNDSFTITCWVKVADTSASIAILSKRNGSNLFEYSLDNHFDHRVFNLDNWVANGGATVYGVDPLSASVPALPDGNWHHIAYVGDGTSLKVYFDGELQSSTDLHQDGQRFSNTDAHFVIGNGGAYNKNHYFSGSIDDIRLYNRPLDEAAIKYLKDVR
jgi:hypothetical protein